MQVINRTVYAIRGEKIKCEPVQYTSMRAADWSERLFSTGTAMNLLWQCHHQKIWISLMSNSKALQKQSHHVVRIPDAYIPFEQKEIKVRLLVDGDVIEEKTNVSAFSEHYDED